MMKWKWYMWEWTWAGSECTSKLVRAVGPEPMSFATVAPDLLSQLTPVETWRGSLTTRSQRRKNGQAWLMDMLSDIWV